MGTEDAGKWRVPNDYLLGDLLGRGGMGQVHIARHRSGRVVAIKQVRNTLSEDRLVVDRLGDEARMLKSVSHPNVVRAIDDGTDSDGMPFLVMDRAFGTPLNQLIADGGALPDNRIASIASQILGGLDAIHDAQIVHADLKSHNVLVDDVDIVTIIDFGLARSVVQPAVMSGLIAGTPAYMAPELIAGGVPTVATDIYAAATVIYEMFTGTTPFSGHISTILTRQLSEDVDPPSRRAPGRKIAPAVDRALLRALDATPTERFPTAMAFAEALASALSAVATSEPIRPLARGSELWLERTTLTRMRAPLGTGAQPPISAVPSDPNKLIAEALSRAQTQIEDRCVGLATETLEAALAQLSPPFVHDVQITANGWRIETVLAALYDTLGKQDRAQRMARVAYRHALQTGCAVAEGRARAQVQRLLTGPRRSLRGSAR